MDTMKKSAQMTVTGTANQNGWDCTRVNGEAATEIHKRGGYALKVSYRADGGVLWAFVITPESQFPRNIVGKDKLEQITAFLTDPR